MIMKICVFLSLFVTFALGCSNLPELEVCNKPEGDCSCQAGLSCVLTKEFIKEGETVFVKQCMPIGEPIEVETVDLDNPEADSPRNKRLFGLSIFKRCSDESECRQNFCCLFGRRCAPKIFKYFTCTFTLLHNCGCRDGLECRESFSFTLPLSGRRISIKQCLNKREA